MRGKKQSLKSELDRLAAQVGEETDLEVMRVLFLHEQGRRILRVTINKEDSVSLNDCERFSRSFGRLLDKEDLIDEQYFLEVESPGIS